ncbi:MAG: PhoH family protein [Thermoanaerobaculia bacterium]|nr:PhoH family protein [Thermoanaerobaculia bacterium]
MTDIDAALFGINDENLQMLEEAFDVKITARGGEVQVQGAEEHASIVRKLITEMQMLAERGLSIRKSAFRTAIRVLHDDPDANLVEFFTGDTLGASLRKVVKPRTLAQKLYLEMIEENDMTFAIGPAGTGKTYLAVAVAAAALNEKLIKRIVLCRPAVEAGEKLGFLPGDLAEKINPYLRPLYDSLYELLGFEKVEKLIDKNIIEIAPLAFMRGRTLSDAFIILDEAQNTTTEQMKMFLTRLGFGSKAVITGDITQIDLPTGKRSGLREARATLSDVDGIAFMEFTDKDVVRHPLVSQIVNAYAIRESELEKEKERAKSDAD